VLDDLLPGKWIVGNNKLRELKEVVVTSNGTASCSLAVVDRLAIEVPYQSDKLIRHTLMPKTEVLIVGEPQSQRLRTSFASKGESYAELLSREENRRLIKVTLIRGAFSEAVIRELVVEDGGQVQQWKDADTKVFAIANAPEDTRFCRIEWKPTESWLAVYFPRWLLVVATICSCTTIQAGRN
jgi:hypothetical protein